VEIAIAATLYFSFAGFLMFPLIEAPPLFSRLAITLCAYEFVTTTLWSFSRRGCKTDCAELGSAFASMAGVEIPLLTGALFVGYGVLVARSW
jgi:hypothetical protein